MSELYIVVGLRAKKGKEEDLKRDLIAVVGPSRKEEGSMRYELFEDDADPGHFIFVEHWASSEAQDKHHNHGAHIKEFNANGMANVDGITFLHRMTRIA